MSDTEGGVVHSFSVAPVRLDKCTKPELLAIAKVFHIDIPSGANKAEVKSQISVKLAESGIMEDQIPAATISATESATAPTISATESATDGTAVAPSINPATAGTEGPPTSPPSEGDSHAGLELALRLKQVELELKKKEIELMQLGIRAAELNRSPAPQSRSPGNMSPSPSATVDTTTFDVSKHLALVPLFKEADIDSYFDAFERIATTVKWPKDMWSILLQCKLVGKAREVCAALPFDQSFKYDVVKETILRAYELVPEAYRQRFRALQKSDNQTHVEFAREKCALFDKWCSASKVLSMNQLRELVILEEFKSCLPERVVLYLNEQKVENVSKAAVCADEFMLTHRNVFSHPVRRNPTGGRDGRNSKFVGKNPPQPGAKNDSEESRACFYCHEKGHVISVCPALQRKNNPSPDKPKPVGFIKSISPFSPATRETPVPGDIDECFAPFLIKGSVSLSGQDTDQVPITILRDTGASQSLMLFDVLPFSEKSFCGSDALVLGVEMNSLRAPLHSVFLRSPLVSGLVQVGTRASLPVGGVAMILGNDLAGEKVFPTPEVVDNPVIDLDQFSQMGSSLFSPACAVTRAQARKDLDVTLNDTFMCSDAPVTRSDMPEKKVKDMLPVKTDFVFDIDKDAFVSAQQDDPSLSVCWGAARAQDAPSAYSVDEGILLRTWFPPAVGDLGWNSVQQVVVPQPFRSQILSLAHDNLAGHLGIRKMYTRILRYFYWPGLKSDVSNFCRSCHVCQVMGKPNQVIPPAPLLPIPVMGAPFEHVVIDCVGPLPKTKSGYQYLLTLMCAATRFPEAIPLRSLKAKYVVKALVNFFSLVGLPISCQSDRGTNFTSKLFAQVLSSLSIEHKKSSAYHPESQGALERFHQTLKSMMKKYCSETGREWDEGLPFLLMAVRESVQESLGFSPNELVFGHSVRGPLRVLRDNLLLNSTAPASNVLDYVSAFRERLHKACELAHSALAVTQGKMKERFDRKSVQREFKAGDRVLLLLPMPTSSLQAKFCGPYVIQRKLSDTDYVIETPDRRRKTRVCHINMLKPYFVRSDGVTPPVSPTPVASIVSVAPSLYSPESDGLRSKSSAGSSLKNSEILENLSDFLQHLDSSARADIIALIKDNPTLFSNTPSRTTVLSHDVDVGGNAPIKQHAYRVNPTKRELFKKEVDYLLENGLAIPSSSAWSSPCLLVPKSDGSQRFCTDFRKVNNVTKPDSYPLPRMEDCVDRVGAAKFVTKLDLLKGYWQVPLTARASEISAFVTPDGLYQYSVMPFGLRNAPATFQRLMRIVLAGVGNCEVYLDDVVAYSDTWQEHMHTMGLIFARLAEANLTLNLSKCEFGRATVTYLGKEVGQGQVRAIDAKVKAILNYPVPTTRRSLRSFIGVSSYYRGFCRNYANVAAPLTSLTSTKVPYVWSAACQHSFDCCKALLCSTPVLAAPNFKKPFKLEVDASDHGAGAVLLQEDDAGIDHPICYFSKKFNGAQCNYSTIEKETLSMLLALQFFEVYVGSSPVPVIVYTDHNPLVFLSQMKNSNQRLMRWSLLVQDFNLEICHKSGADNVLADALSRVFSPA